MEVYKIKGLKGGIIGKIFKIECEFEMPIANGYFSTIEKAQEAIDSEDWMTYTGYTIEEIKKNQYVTIEEIDVK